MSRRLAIKSLKYSLVFARGKNPNPKGIEVKVTDVANHEVVSEADGQRRLDGQLRLVD